MITFFSVPKAFRGHIGLIQRNAILSWVQLAGADNVLLIGDDPGVQEFAAAVGARGIAAVERNQYGTPLLSSAFQAATLACNTRCLCYVNSDIIVTEDLARAVASIRAPDYLGVCRRWNLDVRQEVDYSAPGWQAALRAAARATNQLYPPGGSDIFVFPRDSRVGPMPPFAVGRPSWDNWLIRQARRQGLPVIDLTRQVVLIHQHHDYEHVVGGTNNSWEGPEAEVNRSFHGTGRYFDVRDSTHVMVRGRVYPAVARRYLLRVPRLVYDYRHGIRRLVRLRTRARALGALIRDRAR